MCHIVEQKVFRTKSLWGLLYKLQLRRDPFFETPFRAFGVSFVNSCVCKANLITIYFAVKSEMRDLSYERKKLTSIF